VGIEEKKRGFFRDRIALEMRKVFGRGSKRINQAKGIAKALLLDKGNNPL